MLALALAPLTHFFPSKRQRLVASLREYAAVNGLFVEFRDLPGSKVLTSSGSGRAQQVLYYGLRLPAALKQHQLRRAWVRNVPVGSEQCEVPVWRGVGHREPAHGCLDALPAAVSGIGLDSSSCGIYWQEGGSQSDVEAIRLALLRWAESLS